MLLGVANVIQNGFSYKTAFQVFNVYILLILSSHAIRQIYIRRNWFSLNINTLIFKSLILIFLLSAFWQSLYFAVNGKIFGDKLNSFGEYLINILLYSIFLILWTAVYLTYHLFQKSRQQDLNNLKLQARQSKIELKNLRDQLNPHFLFNSLNNIRALIEIDPAKAKSTITTLSSLLRSSLLSSKKTYITLLEELFLVEQYLKLEKVRFEERLNYEIINEIDEEVFILPFLIQGITENAIKHGISKLVQGGTIKVLVRYEKENLIMEVQNTGQYIKSDDAGIGIENTMRRLEIIYGNKAGFAIKNINDKMVSTTIWINKLKLKQDKNESSYN